MKSLNGVSRWEEISQTMSSWKTVPSSIAKHDQATNSMPTLQERAIALNRACRAQHTGEMAKTHQGTIM